MLRNYSIVLLKLIAVLVLLFIGICLMAYASGYRYNFKAGKLVKVGLISIRSDPRDAKIYINGRFKGATPYKMTSVEPGVYHLKLEKDGFESFEKDIHVEPDIATEENMIELFLADRPEEEIIKNANKLYTLKNKNEAFVIQNKKIQRLNFSDAKTTNIYSAPQNVSYILSLNTNKDENFLILKLKMASGEINFIALSGKNFSAAKNIPNLFGINFERVDFVYGSSYLLGMKDKTLYLLDTKKTVKYPLLRNSGDFSSLDGNVYFVSEETKKMYIYNVEKNKKEVFFNNKVAYTDKRYEKEKEGFFEILNGKFFRSEDKNDLYFLSHDHKLISLEKNPELISSDFKFGYPDDRDRFLSILGSEIRIYTSRKKETIVIARFSEDIKKIAWHPDKYYVFLGIGDEIRVIAADGLNDIKLYQSDSADLDFTVYNKGGDVYLIVLDRGVIKKIRVQ